MAENQKTSEGSNGGSTVKIFGNVSALYLVLLGWAAYAHAADNREWKLGKVLDSQAAKTYVVSSASSNDWAGNGTEVQVRHMAIQSTQLMILGAELLMAADEGAILAGPVWATARIFNSGQGSSQTGFRKREPGFG